MSEERSKSNFNEKLVLGGVLFILIIFEWIEKHPYTTIGIIAIVAFVVYVFVSNRNDGNDPTAPPPGDMPPTDHF